MVNVTCDRNRTCSPVIPVRWYDHRVYAVVISYQTRPDIYSNRPDRVAQLAEHWASIPKVVGSNHTVARHIFQACPVWIYTQSNITQASYSLEYIIPTQQISRQILFPYNR